MNMVGMFLHRAIGLMAVTGLGLLFLLGIASAQGQSCAVPANFYDTEPTLPKTAAALASGGPVSIVVLGGASTLGRAAGSPDRAWPARLAVALTQRFPIARVTVDNRAAAGQTTQDMAARLDPEVIALKPTLVIWETGTMDAVRNTDLDEFRQTMQAGIDRLRAADAEVVGMDMQFSRQTHAMINFGEYETVLRETTDANAVPLFRRHDIMRYWAENGLFEPMTGDHKALPVVASRLYDCIGRAMAEFISRGAQVEAVTPAAHPGSNE